MKIRIAPCLLFAGSLFAGILHGAEPKPPAPNTAAKPPAKSAPTNEAAKKSDATAASPVPKSAPQGVQGMAREFGEQSKNLLAQRKALLDRLSTAKTEEEKQRIIAELRSQQQSRIDAQRERARLIREQMLNTRRDSGVGITTGK